MSTYAYAYALVKTSLYRMQDNGLTICSIQMWRGRVEGGLMETPPTLPHSGSRRNRSCLIPYDFY